MRLVLDSNVIVSGFLCGKGPPAEILKLIRENQIIWVVSEYILSEVFETLSLPRIKKKYSVDPQSAHNLKFLLGTKAVLIPGIVIIENISRDPGDNPILACAVEGKSEYLVTGDDDLLSLENFQGIPIIRPAKFLEIFRFRTQASKKS